MLKGPHVFALLNDLSKATWVVSGRAWIEPLPKVILFSTQQSMNTYNSGVLVSFPSDKKSTFKFGLNGIPPNSYVDVPTLRSSECDFIGAGFFNEISKLQGGH